MKFSIVMGYYNRKKQLKISLDHFIKYYLNNYIFEVIIVDDASNKENSIDELIKKYDYPIKLLKITPEEKGDRINSCVTYNKGFKEASGDVIIIQNPECCHIGDLFKYILNNLKETQYFSFSCFTANTHELTNELINSKYIYKKVNDKDFLDRNSKKCTLGKGFNWYNHPIIKPSAYHFCSAIYKKKLEIIGGFDEKFANGYCFDDNEFLLSIKYVLKLDIINISPEKGFVIHQYHNRDIYNNKFNLGLLYNKNKQLFELKKQFLFK